MIKKAKALMPVHTANPLPRPLPGFLNPWYCVAWSCIPLILHSWLIPERDYNQLWQVPKYLHLRECLMLLSGIVCYSVGLYAVRNYRPIPPDATERNAMLLTARRVTWLGFVLVMLANLIWLGMARKEGFTLTTLREGLDTSSSTDAAELKKEVFKTIPGVTTATQFAMATAMCALYVWQFDRQKRYLAVIALLCATALMRALLRAERLALIELGVSLTALLVWLYFRYAPSISSRVNTVIRFAPIWLPLSAVLLFGVFEYFRSWRYYQHEQKSFVMFVLNRFVGYYATSFNNGALCINEKNPFEIPLPYNTVHGFWAMPLLPGYEATTGFDYDEEWMNFLKLYANPEFNTPSGIAYYLIDYGFLGGCLGWFITGYIVQVIYRRFQVGYMSGLLLYPLVWLALLYMPMASLLGAGRLVPSYLLIFLACWLVARRTAITTITAERRRKSVSEVNSQVVIAS